MFETVREILKVFDKHSLWDEGVELIGSWCFLLYQKHHGAQNYPFRTQDIDFLITVPYRGKKNINLIEELEKLGFRFSFNHDGSIYLWNSELKYDFHILSILPKSIFQKPQKIDYKVFIC